MSKDLTSHLLSLISPPTVQEASNSDKQAWNDFLDHWGTDGIDLVDQDGGEDEEQPAYEPLPTLLDFYKPGPEALALPRVDDDAHHRSVDRDHLSNGEPLALTVVDGGMGPSSTGVEYALAERIRALIREPSIINSLQELLASTADADEIQFEVLQILGMQGEGFDLAAQSLDPQIRPLLAPLLKPVSHNQRNRRAVARGQDGDGRFALPTSQAEADAMIQAQLAQAENRPLWTGERRVSPRIQPTPLQKLNALAYQAVQEEEQYPNVYKSASTSSALSYGGRMALPMGTQTRETDITSEVVIPPANPIPPKLKERLIHITELDPLAAGCFPGYTTLNRIQSIVQPIAMNTNENMLVCAPTGAGKTDVAIMSILRVLSQHVRNNVTKLDRTSIDKDKFKIIYVAPMKALAAEITRKFARRLAWLGIVVKELTGDMQLSKQEIQATQVIVTTPEKWDVVTRKPTGEGEMASMVKLLIIDEVHLLNEDRGAVIETIVARTLRQASEDAISSVTSTPHPFPPLSGRVYDFLKVNRYQGLFFFDASFRPVPLEQHFIGVKGKVRSETSKRNLDQAVFDKVAANLAEGHQVMVFVHARKETVKSGEKLKEMAQEEGVLDDFSCQDQPQFEAFRREIATSKNKEMKQLFDAGIGIHHAGMLRSDRNMIERMFEANCLKVLVCTATLAWGVNLPAHAVVIKGTQVYDSGRGSWVDLSILDVLQIFGRAGRPGYETSGVGYICTTADKLDHYLSAILTQHPIESKLVPGMLDAMNAEISLGTIATVSEAVEWLGYTYLYVRMRRNPFLYGMEHDVLLEDPQLVNKRNALVRTAGRRLAEANMVIFDEINNKFHITDLGRIAAKYYLKHETIEVFNKQFRARLSEADTIALLSQSTEFNQLQVRDNELEELKGLAKDVIPCQVKGGTDTIPGKVNILLQAYICGAPIEDFALVSDTAYVAQNSGRIIRALLEIAMSRKWANASAVLAAMSKSIEKRLWPFQNPLRQSHLQREIIRNLETYADEFAPIELAAKSALEVGQLIHSNEKHGSAVLNAAKQFPTVDIRYALRPLSNDMLRVEVTLEKRFVWNANVHGGAEPFYVWIEDETGMTIYQSQHVLFRQSTKTIDLEFVVPVLSEIPSNITVRVISDRWVGSEDDMSIDLTNLVMPARKCQYTPLLDLPLLSLNSAFGTSPLRDAYSRLFTTFNPIQTQAFWTLFHTDSNVLLSAPSVSGKSTLVDVAAWRTIDKHSKGRILYVCHNSAASDTFARVKRDTLVLSNLRMMRLIRQADFSAHQTASTVLGVSTPSTALSNLTDYGAFFENLSLVVFDDLHLLDPEYEMLILRVLECSHRRNTRIIGCASSLHDGNDLAEWLRVPESGQFFFRPTDRSTAMTTTVQPFSIPHSPTLLKSMVKPVYAAIKANVEEGAIIFVPSYRQCHSVALDLITRSGMEMDLNGFLADTGFDIEPFLTRLVTKSLIEPMLHGIGIWYAGMHPEDSKQVLQLFAAGFLRALIVPRESCWTLKAQAGTVILMGAQYMEIVSSGIAGSPPESRLRNYTLTELVKMQGFAARPRPMNAAIRNHIGGGATGRFHLLCQAEQQEIYLKFLNEGLPLESSLIATLKRMSDVPSIAAMQDMLDDVSAWSTLVLHKPKLPSRQDFLDILSWSFLWKRISVNPTFYDAALGIENERLSRLVDEYLESYFEAKRRFKLESIPATQHGTGEETEAAESMPQLD
ncbi:hypothetical protein QFC19_001583 [Naganishia cerealis]|uniref:Uncharacterized protein n=1 Tax=Naganishia cerealis TaxID=610337 RepID=A0ACC2WHD0_9TREE|nr:hypothetical protein QFC19_001583 [Naganishia cerealis]